MAVLIDMEMPKAGDTILVVEGLDGTLYARIEDSLDTFHRLVEVPELPKLDAEQLRKLEEAGLE